MKLYVGNLSFGATEAALRDRFSQYGEVLSASIITDRDTGRSRGFGFVEMSDADATKAIAGLDKTEFDGRNISVSEARAREDRRGGGGGGGGGKSRRW